jgi:hypothetical protein
MKVPFTSADFLDRAEQCYPLRTGVVDEPGSRQDGGRGRSPTATWPSRSARWPPAWTGSASAG